MMNQKKKKMIYRRRLLLKNQKEMWKLKETLDLTLVMKMI
jgi:hypothetical protein